MKHLRIFLLLMTSILCGCVYHYPFKQGNILTLEKVQKVHMGMSSTQVETVLGSPVLKNVYAGNRMNYVYTTHQARKKMVVKKLVIDFQNDRVVNIRTDL